MCTVSGRTTTEIWASKGDFIDEAAAIGIGRIQKVTTSGSETIHEYDAQKRIQRILIYGEVYYTFDQWDELGRPLHGVLSKTCSGYEIVYTYGARTGTTEILGTGACASRYTTTFDEDGIPTVQENDDGSISTYTTTSRATVCR